MNLSELLQIAHMLACMHARTQAQTRNILCTQPTKQREKIELGQDDAGVGAGVSYISNSSNASARIHRYCSFDLTLAEKVSGDFMHSPSD